MNAIIVDDEVLIANHLKKILEKSGINVIKIANSINEATETLTISTDLYLLDIRLLDGNGIEFGKKLSELNIPFIYITANNEIEIMKKAILTEPQAYITKPFKERDIVAAIEILKLKLKTKNLEIQTIKGKEFIELDTILFCKADNVYTQIFTENGIIIQRTTINDMSEKLSSDFIRIHRSYIVNKNKITSTKANCIYVGENRIPVSKSYKF